MPNPGAWWLQLQGQDYPYHEPCESLFYHVKKTKSASDIMKVHHSVGQDMGML
jgi:hypothetical protein